MPSSQSKGAPRRADLSPNTVEGQAGGVGSTVYLFATTEGGSGYLSIAMAGVSAEPATPGPRVDSDKPVPRCVDRTVKPYRPVSQVGKTSSLKCLPWTELRRRSLSVRRRGCCSLGQGDSLAFEPH